MTAPSSRRKPQQGMRLSEHAQGIHGISNELVYVRWRPCHTHLQGARRFGQPTVCTPE